MLTLGGLRANLRSEQKSADAIVGMKRAIPRYKGQGWKPHRQTEGQNVRTGEEIKKSVTKRRQPNRIRELLN